MIRIGVGLPTAGEIKTDTVLCLMELVVEISKKHEYCIFTMTGRLEENRNMIVDMAIKHNCSHLLFIDSDMTFPKDTLDVLLKEQKDIIGCNAAKHITGNPVVCLDSKGIELDYVKNKISEVIFIGMAVTLINMEVFKVMKWPWFEIIPIYDKRVLAGEDVLFCKKAKQMHGISTYCHLDLSIKIGHTGNETKTLTKHVQKQIDKAKKELCNNTT